MRLRELDSTCRGSRGARPARHVEELRSNGLSDGEILELNQVAAYFNYVNRTVLGLGVSLEPDIENESTA